MEKRLLIFCCILLFAVSAGSVYAMIINPGMQNLEHILYDNNSLNDTEVSFLSQIKSDVTLINDDEGPHDMRFEFPKNVDTKEILFTSDYFNNILEMTVKGIDSSYFSNFAITGKTDRVNDITYVDRGIDTVIKIKFNKITITKHDIKGRLLYLDFINPSQAYDKIVVIDPGFGGEEYGIVFDNTYEKDINLSIAKKVNKLFEKEQKIGIFCTRLSDSYCSVDDRVDFAKSVDANLYISICQNSTASGRESEMNGAQVQYFSADKSEASKDFAKALIDNIVKSLGCKDMGVVAGDGNEIFKRNDCPTVIVNVGYMTNQMELEQLINDEYQNKCAKAIYDTIMENIYENSNSDR